MAKSITPWGEAPNADDIRIGFMYGRFPGGLPLEWAANG